METWLSPVRSESLTSPEGSLCGADLCSGARPLRRGAGRLRGCRPRMAALVFPLAVINEFLLMDFWLAFSGHLARSWASCHSSNGTAYDPYKGSVCWRIILPFPFLLAKWKMCFLCFLENTWSTVPVWDPWYMEVLSWEGLVWQKEMQITGVGCDF